MHKQANRSEPRVPFVDIFRQMPQMRTRLGKSSRHQTPSNKNQAPNTKLQTSSEFARSGAKSAESVNQRALRLTQHASRNTPRVRDRAMSWPRNSAEARSAEPRRNGN